MKCLNKIVSWVFVYGVIGILVLASEEVHVQKIPKSVSTFHVEVAKDIQTPAAASQTKPELEKQGNDHPARKTTYVERTVIPNYVEKTIQVGSDVKTYLFH